MYIDNSSITCEVCQFWASREG